MNVGDVFAFNILLELDVSGEADEPRDEVHLL